MQDELFKAEHDIRSLRQRYQTQGAFTTSDVVFTEWYDKSSIRFKVRNLNLDNQGNALFVREDGSIEATMEIMHDCQKCGNAINQIIVGIGGEEKAQACVWNGFQSSNGWKTVAYTLKVPKKKGVYYVRNRYAQAYRCGDALEGWWKIDRPEGSTSDSNIGVIVVSP